MKFAVAALVLVMAVPAAAATRSRTVDVYERGHKVETHKHRLGRVDVYRRGHKVRTYRER